MIYFVILYSLFFIVLTWFRQKYALFLLLALLPTYQIRFQVFSIPLTLLEVMILILFVIYILRNTKNFTLLVIPSPLCHSESRQSRDEESLISYTWQWLILAWIVIATIAVFIAPELRSAAGIWKAYFIEPILLLLVFLSLVKTKKDVSFVIGALSFSALYISVWAILQKFVGGGVLSTEVWGAAQVWRATGPFPHPNFLGLYLGPIILLAISQAVSYLKKNVLVTSYGLLVTILSLSAIILARSEGALLGVFTGIVFLGLAYRSARKWTIAGLIILIIIIGILPGARSYVIEKATFSDLSGQLRINIWQGAAAMIRHAPIVGAGLNGYQRLAPAYQNRYYHPETGELISAETHPYPHNIFLAMWLELGLVGLAIFLLIIVKFFFTGLKCLKPGFKHNNHLSVIIYSSIAAMIVILIHGLVDTPYFKNDLAVLFWLIIGFMILQAKKSQAKSPLT
ncbi:O-antigen ligase family protein [Patescibacteria group bacterium AH-259-L07]|nr:O-antigen ligase family protein [Patescibacteria group bacterium AH-259-L07]